MDGDDDPLTHALRPPRDETPERRAERIREEQEALRISEDIDKELNRERAEKKKDRAEIKVLLLGPSGSGKSTTLKNFQLVFTPKALQAQAAKYTALVFLNVVTSVRFLCDVLEDQESQATDVSLLRDRCAQLRPVLDLETILASWFHSDCGTHTQPPRSQSGPSGADRRRRRSYELTSNVIGGLWGVIQPSSIRRRISNKESWFTEGRENIRQVLEKYREEIEVMAQHPTVRESLAARSQRLEHIPGFFLNDLGRITAPGYSPTDDDVLRTRMRTLGASETRFKLESGPDKGRTWVIIDVGGSRHQRAAWIPYFDDVNAILFMAPIGDFDQYLEEDRSINCLKDCLDLFGSLISNRLLRRVEIILLLNKYDVLREKLDAGVQFSEFVTSYKDRNVPENVGRYINKKFSALHKLRSSNPKRIIHSHFTSVTDKSSTTALIAYLRYAILRNSLGQTKLL